MLGTTLPTPMYALYAERMHFSVLTTTVIYATYAGGVLFALLAFGRWSDAVGPTARGAPPVVIAALASAVVFLLADSVPLLNVGFFAVASSAGLFTGTGTAAVIEAAPPSWRTWGRRRGHRGECRRPRPWAHCWPACWCSTHRIPAEARHSLCTSC